MQYQPGAVLMTTMEPTRSLEKPAGSRGVIAGASTFQPDGAIPTVNGDAFQAIMTTITDLGIGTEVAGTVAPGSERAVSPRTPAAKGVTPLIALASGIRKPSRVLDSGIHPSSNPDPANVGTSADTHVATSTRAGVLSTHVRKESGLSTSGVEFSVTAAEHVESASGSLITANAESPLCVHNIIREPTATDEGVISKGKDRSVEGKGELHPGEPLVSNDNRITSQTEDNQSMQKTSATGVPIASTQFRPTAKVQFERGSSGKLSFDIVKVEPKAGVGKYGNVGEPFAKQPNAKAAELPAPGTKIALSGLPLSRTTHLTREQFGAQRHEEGGTSRGTSQALPNLSHGTSIATESDSAVEQLEISRSSQRGSLVTNDPFARLNSSPGTEFMRMHANSKELTVGVESGVLGWIQVKATSERGQVSASIHAETAAIAHNLGGHLPALSAFLVDRDVHVRELQMSGGESGNSSGGEATNDDRRGRGGGNQTADTLILPDEESQHSELGSISLISVRV